MKLLYLAILINLFGIMELFRINRTLAQKQIIFLTMGLVLYLIMKRINLKKLLLHPWTFYISGLVLLTFPLFLSRGNVKRWIMLGPVAFQPSEVSKLFYILFLAGYYSTVQRGIDSGRFFRALAFSLVYFALVFIEPDFATASSFLFIFGIVSFIAGVDFNILLLFLLVPLSIMGSFSLPAYVVLILLLGLYIFLTRPGVWFGISFYTILFLFGLSTPYFWRHILKPYQRERIISFLDPEKHRATSGWQVYQAKIALGAAGLTGKLGEDINQKNLKFLPAPHTDFIFSSIGEDIGFIGLTILLFLYLLMFYFMVQIIVKAKKTYIRLYAAGVLSFFLYHTVFNIASNLGLFPVAGIPLALVSYGGTHLITEYLTLGILEGMYERGE